MAAPSIMIFRISIAPSEEVGGKIILPAQAATAQ